YFSRIPPIKVNANSKKSAFDQSAGVSAVCAKVSPYMDFADYCHTLDPVIFHLPFFYSYIRDSSQLK
ncbi:hypothetical protein, partial [Methyloglobulus sp.]|uniref:hypothetical protein n=1 Tax=Methyloglobulus sp. TaxID=2518622 RepID=UPI0032B7085F